MKLAGLDVDADAAALAQVQAATASRSKDSMWHDLQQVEKLIGDYITECIGTIDSQESGVAASAGGVGACGGDFFRRIERPACLPAVRVLNAHA